jgi:hypothetical protein
LAQQHPSCCHRWTDNCEWISSCKVKR